MSFSGAKGSVVFRGGVVGPTVGPGLVLEDHTAGSAVAIFDRVKLIGTNTGPYVRGMADWPNCTAPICIRCLDHHPHCLESAPSDYNKISDRTPGGLVFAELEVDPACAGGAYVCAIAIFSNRSAAILVACLLHCRARSRPREPPLPRRERQRDGALRRRLHTAGGRSCGRDRGRGQRHRARDGRARVLGGQGHGGRLQGCGGRLPTAPGRRLGLRVLKLPT